MAESNSRIYTLYVGEWVVPVASEPVYNGAVLVNREGTIIDTGERNSLVARYGIDKSQVCLFQGKILIPSLVNAHTHLYYSAFKDYSSIKKDSFPGWLSRLVESGLHEEESLLFEGIKNAAERMYACGISLVGNLVTNPALEIGPVASSSLKGILFLEGIGFKNEIAGERFESLLKYQDVFRDKTQRFSLSLAPHSVYSCSAELIKKIIEHSKEGDLPVSMHLAESRNEADFLFGRDREMVEFLRSRDAWEPGWKPPMLSPVQYLDSMNLLSENLLAVHLVQVDQEDIKILQQRNVQAVLCPGSNITLDVGLPPVEKLLDAGINICLGTDSAASNSKLDIFNEMGLIKKNFPSVPSAEIIQMATLNGARALGMDNEYGSFEPGKQADILMLPMDDKITDDLELEDYIVTSMKGSDVTRLLIP